MTTLPFQRRRPAPVAGLLLSLLWLSGCAAPPTADVLPTPVLITQAVVPTATLATDAPAADTPIPPTLPPPTPTPASNGLALVTVSEAPALAAELRGQGWEVTASVSTAPDGLRAAAQAGAGVVVGVGYALSDLAAAAEAFPASHFIGLIETGPLTAALPANARAFTQPDAREDQAGFLAGMVAGLATQTDRVAVLADVSGPVGLKYRNGFLSGVRYICPQCRLDTIDLTDPLAVEFGAAEGGKYAALGADVLFAAAGPAGDAALQAAAAAGAWVIGAGRDVSAEVFQMGAAAGAERVLTSVYLDPAAALSAALAEYTAGRPGAGLQPLALANGGVRMGPLTDPAGALSALDRQDIEQTQIRLADRTLETGVDPLTGVER